MFLIASCSLRHTKALHFIKINLFHKKEYCEKLQKGVDKSSDLSHKQIWKIKEKKAQAPSGVKTGLVVPTIGQLYDRTNIYNNITYSKCIRSK
jgi:hypothetical protein